MKSENKAFSRRAFMKISAGALGVSAAAGACAEDTSSAGSSAAVASGPEIPNGVQLYCVRHQIEERGLEPLLGELAGIGFQGVEFADYHGRSAAELRQMLDGHGLRACGSHVYIETMMGDERQRSIDFHQAIGNPYVIVRWMDEEMHATRDDLLRTCEQYNEIAAAIKSYGMRIGYHNHGYIYETYEEGGATKWDIFADHTVEDVVLQLDTGNAASHVSPIDVLRRNPGRFATMHIKPWDPDDPDVFMGEDALDWDTIIEEATANGGVDWYIIEYERDAFPPLEALQANLEAFQELRAA